MPTLQSPQSRPAPAPRPRGRPSEPAGLLDLDEACALVLSEARAIAAGGAHAKQALDLGEALGRVLAADVISAIDVPPFDSSAMDGFAVRAADTCGASRAQPVRLSVVAESRAGRPSGRALGAGEAIAISTGAAIPPGADAIVRVEDTHPQGAGHVAVLAQVRPGGDVRRRGEDIRAGQVSVRGGERLGPVELGVLASVGCKGPLCVERPRVRILTSGDELRAPGEPLEAGCVYDANAHVVAALARRAGARVLGAERARDDPAQLRAALGRCLQADVAVVCGGLSVGAHDHVREGLAALGVQERFAGVALKPGRPAWFGTFAGTGQGGRRRRTLVFGLPGNPLSSLAAFVLLAAPALRTLAGLRPPTRGASAALSEPYEKPAGRTHAVPCRLRHDGERLLAQPAWVPGSHVLSSALGADALAIVPATCERVSAGERVRVELVDR